MIVLIDFNNHDGYNPTCEEERMEEIWGEDVDHRKIVFVRFNSDKYKGEDGKVVLSPWKVNKYGVFTVILK